MSDNVIQQLLGVRNKSEEVDEKFENGKIYKVYSPQEEGLCYIGSTYLTLEERYQNHKDHYKSWLKGKADFVTVYKLFEKHDDCVIEKIEDFPCNNEQELKHREGHYQRLIPCVNKKIEGRTREEYYQDNKQKYINYQKQYHEINKEKRNSKIICDICRGRFTYQHKAYHNRSKKHNQALCQQSQQTIIYNIEHLTINNSLSPTHKPTF